MGSRKILCEASEKGVVVVNKCLDNGISIDTMKLQQLLIIIHGTMLSLYKRPFFKEKVVAREHNLIISEVNRDFLSNLMGFKERIPEYICLLDDEEKIMDEVIAKYGELDFFEINIRKDLNVLRKLCYRKGEPSIVPNELIEEVFDYYKFYELDIIKGEGPVFQKKFK